MNQSEYIIIQEGESAECAESMRLPFEPSAHINIGFGGYSTVYKEIIRPGYFRYKTESLSPDVLNKDPLPVARKWFPYAPDFERELLFRKALDSAPNRCHDRIVKHLAVLIDPVASKHSLLLPLADSDLEKYLDTEDFSKFPIQALVNELVCLAGALAFLHEGVKTSEGARLICSHMDLKPSSLLIFPRGSEGSAVGTWKITDFSTSTLTDESGYEHLSPPRLVPETYMAPEIQVPVEENKADPACDIWSLGCIVLEVLVGHVEGSACKSWKDRQRKLRYYYEKQGQAFRVEGQVWEWLNADHVDNSVMMCKKIIMDMLKIDPEERPTAEQVRHRMAMLLE